MQRLIIVQRSHCSFVYELLVRCLQDDQIAVVVGTITDDVRVYDVTKLRVCALRFTATARARILQVQHIAYIWSFSFANNQCLQTCVQQSQ